MELASLRSQLSVFGRDIGDIKTSCAVLVERTTRRDADLRQLRADAEKEITALREKVEALEGRRFPLPVVSTLAAVTAVIVAVIALFAK